MAVLEVVGDLESIRAELSGPGSEPCLISADYSYDQLSDASERVGVLLNTDAYVYSVSAQKNNRVSVVVAVADELTMDAIGRAVGNSDLGDHQLDRVRPVAASTSAQTA